MYFAILIIAVTAYSIQQISMAYFSRRIESLSVAIYRNLTLPISMFPLLFLGTLEDIFRLQYHIADMMIACICGAIAVYFACISLKIMPVGIGGGVRKPSSTLTLLFLGSFLFGEYLSTPQILLVIAVLLGVVLLKLQKIDIEHLHEGHVIQGVLYSIANGIFTALAFTFMIKVARTENPFVVGYFWELGIGIWALLFGGIRYLLQKKPIQKISLKTFQNILLGSSPTLIGTGGVAFASQFIPLGIVGTIQASNLLITTLLAYLFFREKLFPIQIMGMIVIVGSIIGLHLVS